MKSNYSRSGIFLKYCDFLSIWADKFEQIVQTLIRLLQKEQSDQGLHCLPFSFHLSDALLHTLHIVIPLCSCMVIILGIVKPVLRGHPREGQKVAA